MKRHAHYESRLRTLGPGLLGTGVYAPHRGFYTMTLIPVVKPIYGVFGSIAMAAIATLFLGFVILG